MIFPGGDPETQCGAGSTMAATAAIRGWLPDALRRLKVDLLIDAPCGDRNWIRHVELPCEYWGIEVDEAHLPKAREDGAHVTQADLRDMHFPLMPGRTAILSRDFFQHLDDADGMRVLENFRASQANYLIATDHGVEENGPLQQLPEGPFRPVNMSAAPFNLGEPIDQCDDGKHGRILGVWRL